MTAVRAALRARVLLVAVAIVAGAVAVEVDGEVGDVVRIGGAELLDGVEPGVAVVVVVDAAGDAIAVGVDGGAGLEILLAAGRGPGPEPGPWAKRREASLRTRRRA